jgi:hypothetical protein
MRLTKPLTNGGESLSHKDCRFKKEETSAEIEIIITVKLISLDLFLNCYHLSLKILE